MSANRTGRHRYGQPGLRYCLEIEEVRLRLRYGPSRRRAAVRAPGWASPGFAVAAIALAGALVASGWLATGVPAVAEILSK